MENRNKLEEALSQILEDCGHPVHGEAKDLPLKSISEVLRQDHRGVLSTYPELPEVIHKIYAREFYPASDLCAHYAPTKLRDLRIALNQLVLAPLEREWTSHGICRSFRFWTDNQKRNYLTFTNWVIEALSDEFLACLGYGAVLSATRDNEFIPHDDDLDLIVLIREGQAKTFQAGFSRVFARLTNFGFKIKGDYVAHRHVCNERYFLDVFVGMEEEGYASWHPGPRKQIKVDQIFPSQEAELMGVKFPIPNDPEAYLAAVYGEDWRDPQPGWSHNFDPSPYRDWFFPKKK